MVKTRVFTKETLLRKHEIEEVGVKLEDKHIRILGPPEKFAKLILEFDSFDYQKRALNDFSKRQCLVWGRQTGKSTTIAVKAIYLAMRKNQIILIVSPSQRQSTLLFDKIRALVSSNLLLSDSIVRMTQTVVEFMNGSKVYSLPAGTDGVTIRGFSANWIIAEEAGYIKDEAFTAIIPMLAATQGGLIVMGTPFGMQGRLYESYIDTKYSVSHNTSEICPLIQKEVLEDEKLRLTNIEYRQEYLAEFLEEASSFFPRDVLFGNKALMFPGIVEDYELKREPKGMCNYYLGVDFARQGEDLSVFIVLEEGGAKNKIVWIEETHHKRLTDVVGRVKSLNQIFRFKRIFLDETGLGAGPTDNLIEARLPCTPVTMTQTAKEELYFNLRNLFEKGELLIPHHRKLIFELHNLQYQYKSNGKVSFHHPEHGNIHDDYPDALALVAWSLKGRKKDRDGLAHAC